ncbi:MAG: pyruvate, phosphate dikinase [Sedimentibacter saalensis]|uniref:Pyruvate, phosphate dikinase n=1 Tax=Sedimentibacter saalensis TaxID=130788 RepID=A0A562J3Y0_9FIRM|nr:pyruvate, phosphate dikinase [Sedimentibacter saalensis]MEA5096419.1 pyruvate, phosphate dikinase [Sedimentibacter saalensis]TWH77575.1 pyruvate phosphate dikinase [Sedimentibacter saalensis]
MSKKWVYLFKEGNASQKYLLGGKGANLSEMTNIGLPVPPGITVTTEACTEFYEQGKKLTDEIINQIKTHMTLLEEQTGKKFGDEENPLLVSVRSGAAFSMPGMMDTILNLGLNDLTVEGMANKTGNPRFAYDSYRRFIQMFGDVVLEIPKYKFDNVLDDTKEKNNYKYDTELTADDLKQLVKEFKEIYKKETKSDFPQEPEAQLLMAVEAVFRSWNNQRAITYRNLYDIPHNLGTAVNVQSMVFGNMGDSSGTGVAFTRNPSTGEKKVFGEFLINAQGEDVVAGIRTPLTIDKLNDVMPEIYKEFMESANTLEQHYKDMQDIEFTIEQGKLYFLQTRNGKRTAEAALRAAVEMVGENLIDKKTAVMRVDPKSLDQLLHPKFDPDDLKKATPVAKGLPASPGAATGKIYFTADEAVAAAKNGEAAILVRKETSPEDIEGMSKAKGILTSRGGMTSHAAVVARGMGKCCVAGCETIFVDEARKTMTIEGKVYTEGDYISLDGSTGNVYIGKIKTVEANISGNFGILMEWADEFRKLKIRTNADTPNDSAMAVKFGAEGIGLCRTEHMFFEESRIFSVRKMIIADTVSQREKALAEILPMQKNDFKGIFKIMGVRPVTIRLLDPPLHEFIPTNKQDIEDLARDMNVPVDKLTDKINSLHEFNPMLGHRGCRLAVTYPEIAKMQSRAIMEAAIEVSKEENITIVPEIMVPLVGKKSELDFVKKYIVETAEEVKKEMNSTIEYLVGTMIEVPRACVTADEIAETADFFSFGTNDLTQMTFGFSRDDAGKFINDYKEVGILEQDPFQSIDQDGVGKMVSMAVKLGRAAKDHIHLGVCGEHGGDPASIEFFHRTGLDYVSCSPFRVPIARLAAAQSAIKSN